MKINIITFFWSNNFGALIQASSLKNFIEKEINKTAIFNSYAPKKLILRERMSQLNNKNLIKFPSILFKKFKLYNWKINILKCDNPNQKKNFTNGDFYIYGSDEIWNYQNFFFGFDPFFFGEGNTNKKLSYAVSIGNSNFNNQNYIDLTRKLLIGFDQISVRDYATQKFVEKSTGKKPIIVLDPCFLINLENIYQKKTKYNLEKKKYILIYGDYFDAQQIKSIKHIGKKNNWKIVSVGFYNKWADENYISLDPLDLIFFFINSNIVFTSMFHGVMLSYKYKKQFWFSEDPYRKNKLSYFVDYLNLKSRRLDLINDSYINFNINRNKIDDWINVSKSFLKDNIKALL